MKYKILGKSGLRVSELCLGTMTFGEDWGWGAPQEVCQEIFDLYTKQGGNFIDTANYYTNGSSEKIVGELIAADRDYFVLSTKYTLNMNPSDPNAGGNHRKNLKQSVEASLRRLNTDCIDILWLHAWDNTTPVHEIMRALDDLVRQGKVLHLGISDTPSWVIAKGNMLAELRGWTSFIGMQMQYNLLERSIERELIPLAKSDEMSILAWGPLASGILTGKYNKKKNTTARLKEDNPRLTAHNLNIAQKVVDIANKLDRSPAQVALNWVRQKSDQIIPLIGSRKSEQFKDNLDCLNFEIPVDQMNELNEISKIQLGFPHDFLASESVKQIIFGQLQLP